MPVIRENIQPPALPLRRVEGHILYSHVVSVAKGRLIFISGQLARDASGTVVGVGDMAAQIEQVGRNIEACLAAAGASLSDLVRTTTYTTDIEEYFRHVEVRMRYFGAGMPTSTTVEVRRLSHSDFLVEVEALAIIE
jgi:enamine deaminase RidA (YjgF/YER057c/UK114 family)